MTIISRPTSLRRRWAVSVAASVLATGLVAGCTTVPGTPEVAESGASSYPSGQSSGAAGGLGAEAERADDPTTRQLIAAALEAGEIDEPTSWLYRTWAEFGDPSLPEQYQGAPDAHDLDLLVDLPSRLDELPDDVRAQVEPYFLRPTDPNSAFNAGDDPPGLRSGRSAPFTSKSDPPIPWWQCRDGWAVEPVPDLPFVVWICRDLDRATPGATADAVATTTSMVADHASQMMADMGPVIPDDPATDPHPQSDDRIDIYVLPPGSLGPTREGDKVYFHKYMKTVSSPPYSATTSSAYVLASADELADPAKFERELVHELFHVLQYTHNVRLDSRWFYDASAEWASAHYVRHDSARLHQVRLPVLQNAAWLSLQYEYGLHPYGAYLWPLFMEQEAGPESVFATWTALAKAPRNAGRKYVMDALNKQLDVADNFPEFVMRMYNANALQGDPIRPRFVDLDSNFPDGTTPDWKSRTLGDDPLEVDYQGVWGTGYHYAPVKVPPEEPGSDYGVIVTIAGDMQTPDGHLPSLEALVQGEDGDYHRQTINYHGDGQKVCVKDELILVLANQSMDEDDFVEGSAQLERVKDEHDKDKRCGKVEANNPETLTRLAKSGEVVKVSGTEGDGDPDSVPVFVTVSNVRPDRVAKYQVEVQLTGGTLDAPREFTWPLSGFAPLGDSDKYRKSTIVLLDRDLTDNNRDFTIDTRLIGDDGSQISAHVPTVELHGERASECSFDIDYVVIAPELSEIEIHNLRLKNYPLTEYKPVPGWGNGGTHSTYRPVGPIPGHDRGSGVSPVLVTSDYLGGESQSLWVNQNVPPHDVSWAPPQDSMPYTLRIAFVSDLLTEDPAPFTFSANVDLSVFDYYHHPEDPDPITMSEIYRYSGPASGEIESIEYRTNSDGTEGISRLTFTISSSDADSGGLLEAEFHYVSRACSSGD